MNIYKGEEEEKFFVGSAQITESGDIKLRIVETKSEENYTILLYKAEVLSFFEVVYHILFKK